VTAQPRHAGQALVVQLRPDRSQRIVDMPAVADEDLHPRGARLPVRQAAGTARTSRVRQGAAAETLAPSQPVWVAASVMSGPAGSASAR